MIILPDQIKSRRAALIALGVAAIVVMLIIAVPILALFGDQHDEIDDNLQQIAVYKAEIDARPAIAARLKSIEQAARAMPGLIESESAELAQSQLQSDVKSMVESNGGAVRSAQIIPATAKNGVETIAIQYDITLPMARLASLVYAIESHAPYLFIDQADIAAPPNWQPSDAQGQPPPDLEVRWTVRGYHRAVSR